MNEAEKQNEQIEAQARRDKLKFYGLNEEASETWEQSEKKVRSYLLSELLLDKNEHIGYPANPHRKT